MRDRTGVRLKTDGGAGLLFNARPIATGRSGALGSATTSSNGRAGSKLPIAPVSKNDVTRRADFTFSPGIFTMNSAR